MFYDECKQSSIFEKKIKPDVKQSQPNFEKYKLLIQDIFFDKNIIIIISPRMCAGVEYV